MATVNSDWYYPVGGGNYSSFGYNTSGNSSATIYVTPQFQSNSATSGYVAINGPVQISADPPRPRTEIERLLADVEDTCRMAR